MRKLWLFALLGVLLQVAPAQGEGPQFPVGGPCVLQWVEADTFKVYTTNTKGAKPDTLIGTVQNDKEGNPPKTWSVPCPTTPGQYYWAVTENSTIFGVQEGPQSYVKPFSIFDKTIPITVTGIQPFAGKQGAQVPVTITGSGFLNGGMPPSMFLQGSNTSANNIVIVNDTTMTATLNIPLAETVGTYVLVIGDPNATPPRSATLASGFAVLTNVQTCPCIGGTVQVMAALLNVRQSPAGFILGTQTQNTVGTVADGPQTAGGSTWWKVTFPTGVSGWVNGTYLSVPGAPAVQLRRG